MPVSAPSVNQVFTVDFEVKPLYVEADYSLSLNVQPVEIVYDEHSLSEVAAFFQVPQGSVDLRSTAVTTFQEMARYSRAGLQYAIEQHTTVHIALNMRSPYIVIPEFGTLHRGGNVLIVDFGTLHIESELQPKDVSLEDATMSEIESRLYDQFNITVKDVKVLLADSGDDWHTAQILPNSEFHVLPSVQLLLTFFSAVRPDYRQLPRQKFVARVPSLEVNISDKRLLLLMSFLRNFPVPASTSMATIGDDVVDGMGPSVAPLFTFDLAEAQLEPDLMTLRRIKRSVLGRGMAEIDDLPAYTSPGKHANRASSGEDYFLSASDHSDEDMEHFSEALHIKPVDDNSSQSNTVNILLRMSLNEFVVNMSKVMDKQVRPYLMLRVDRLRIDSAITEHGYAAHATLGGIQLVDKIHVGSSGEYMEVLRTEPSNNLVSVMYRKVDPKCPDFASDYGSMEHALKVKFHSITTLLDQASLMYLHAFIQGLISSVQNLDMKTSTSSVISTSDVSTKDRSSLTDRLTSITDEVDKLPPLSTKLNLTAELSEVTVRLCDSDNSLAQIQISGLEGSMLVKSSRTIVRARLKDFSMEDCSVGAIYPKILMIEDKTGSLFDLKFVKYKRSSDHLPDNKKKGRTIDYSVRLCVGHLQTVYLAKFYWELTRFFEPFINNEMMQTGTQVAVETIQKQVEDIQSQNLRVALNVDLRTPTILVPRHSKSIDMVMVELGDLSVKNYFNFTNIPPDMRQEWNHIYLNLHNIQVKSVRLNLADDRYEVLHTILEPIAFKADVRIAMKPIFSETCTDVSGHLEKVKLNILQRDLQLMIGLTTENLLEGAPAPSPGLFESPTIQNLEEKASVGTETTTALESRNDSVSVESEQKTSVNVLLRLEGLSAILFEEKETEQAQWVKTSLCLVDVEKLNINALIVIVMINIMIIIIITIIIIIIIITIILLLTFQAQWVKTSLCLVDVEKLNINALIVIVIIVIIIIMIIITFIIIITITIIITIIITTIIIIITIIIITIIITIIIIITTTITIIIIIIIVILLLTFQAQWVKTSLCLVDVEKLNINALQQSDGDLKVNFSLQSLVIDDTRPHSLLAVPRILYCPQKQKTSDEFPLVSLIYKVSSDGNQKADLMVEKLRLNVHIPFMLVLIDFFTGAIDTGTVVDVPDMPSASRPAAGGDNSASSGGGAGTAFNVYGSLKQPEIIVFADPSSAESKAFAIYSEVMFEYRADQEQQALWAKSEVVFEYRADLDQQALWAKVSNLYIHSCLSAQKPSANTSQVMAPCSIEFRQTFDVEKPVREMSASVTSVKVFLSASVMAMLWDIASHMQHATSTAPSPAKGKKTEELTNLWGISAVTNEKWLRDKPDYGMVRKELHAPERPEEILKVEVKEVCAFFEIVNLDHNIPILCLRSSLESTIKDWSKKLYLEAELHLDMMYYNEKLSTWEPLIEPVMEKEGLYRPWEVLIKVVRARSFPMLCMYEDHNLDVPDGLQSEVQEMMHRARVRSSSSETDTDSSSDMTVIRHKSLRRVRHGSERSYDSVSHHSSVQGESDSEPEGFINSITNKLGSILSSDSSDADVSETDDTEDVVDLTMEKPVFLTSRGPVDVSTGLYNIDEVDSGGGSGGMVGERSGEGEGEDTCLYLLLDSLDSLHLNLTPQGVAVLQDVTEALTSPATSALCSVRDKPSFEIENKLGLHSYVTLHPDIKVSDGRICKPDQYLK
ncbi:hypothetical protein ACOMHN_043746 [Nucella lapillus]